MSDFSVPVIRIERVEDHPNADRLSLVYFKEFCTISAKLDDGSHRYNPGDLAVYVPEGAIVPENLLKQGFWDETKNRGILSGAGYDRVKAIKLRGVVSQGIMFPVTGVADSMDEPADQYWIAETINLPYAEFEGEGQDMAEYLGITKWEPKVPTAFAGKAVGVHHKYALKYDFENWKKVPGIFTNGEEVVFTEKIHGTFCCITLSRYPIDPTGERRFFNGGRVTCSSKGLGARGIVFEDTPENDGNLYVQATRAHAKNIDYALAYMPDTAETDEPEQMYLVGEIFGTGVQDLGYGQAEPTLRLFDVARRFSDGEIEYLDPGEFEQFCLAWGFDRVPVLYRGPFSREAMQQYTDGESTICPGQIREGIVVKTVVEHAQRKIAKSVSEAYLLRKGETTEFQ